MVRVLVLRAEFSREVSGLGCWSEQGEQSLFLQVPRSYPVLQHTPHTSPLLMLDTGTCLWAMLGWGGLARLDSCQSKQNQHHCTGKAVKATTMGHAEVRKLKQYAYKGRGILRRQDTEMTGICSVVAPNTV